MALPNLYQFKPNYSVPMSSATNKTAANYMGREETKSSSTSKAKSSSAKQPTSGNKSSSDSAAKDAASALKKQQEKLRASLGSAFAPTIAAYKDMIGWLPEEQGTVQGQVDTMADTNKKSINDALDSALEKYTGYRGEVATNQASTLKDLESNTRNAFAAGSNYLGARGAGNSSATGMYSAAQTQASNKERADVLGQANQQYNDINMQEADTRGQTQQAIDSVDTWKASRTTEVVTQYQELKRDLTAKMAQADSSQKMALAQLDASLFQSAVNNLNTITQMAAQYKYSIQGNIATQNTNNAKIANDITSAASVDVQPIATGELPGIAMSGGPIGGSDSLASSTGGVGGGLWKQDEQGNWYQSGLA